MVVQQPNQKKWRGAMHRATVIALVILVRTRGCGGSAPTQGSTPALRPNNRAYGYITRLLTKSALKLKMPRNAYKRAFRGIAKK